MLLKRPYVEFFSQTRKTCIIAINLAVQHKLGGRDSLIIANFIANKVPTIYTRDHELLVRKKISWKSFNVAFKDPVDEG